MLELCTHVIEVDDHCAVAHVCGLVVGLAAGWEGHASGARADGHAQSCATGLRRRAGVTHHQTFPFQDDGLCVVLSAGLQGPPEQQRAQQGQEVELDQAQVHDFKMFVQVPLLDDAGQRCHFG